MNKKMFENSREHLSEELKLMELYIKRQIALMNLTGTAYNKFDEFSGMYISEDEIKHYLDHKGNTENPESIRQHKTVKSLSDEIARLRKHIKRCIDYTQENGPALRLLELKRRFQLTETELDILVCCISPDIDIRFQRYFAYLQNDVSKKRPTVQLLSRMFLGEKDNVFQARSLFNKETSLFNKKLLNFKSNESIKESAFPVQMPVAADSVTDFLLGMNHLDSSLQTIARLIDPEPMEMYAAYYNHHLRIIKDLINLYEYHGKLPPTYIGGPVGAGKTKLVDTFAGILNRKVLKVNYNALYTSQEDKGQILAAIERETYLHDCILHICFQHIDEEIDSVNRDRSKIRELNDFLEGNQAEGVFITYTKSYNRVKEKIAGNLFSFYIPMPTVEERVEIWSCLLNCANLEDEEDLISNLAVKFRFTPERIHAVLKSVAHLSTDSDDNQKVVELADIYRCCREESNQGLLAYSQKIKPHYKWKDIILPTDTFAQLQEICSSIQNRRKVYGEWGFESKFSLGKGLNILFSGPPGIGKTMSAEIIANELGLDIYKIDLSCVVSKYIGETEKNLSKIFREAGTGNCILFFDEADALFGKRTEVRDSHDRYANIEINYLLQKMDDYEGIVLLATNMRKNLDPAFTRRLHHLVEFPFPDGKYRERIWRNMFPDETPVSDDIDFEFLAEKFKIAGGNIKNIAINSAFMASTNGGVVDMENIIMALKREYHKMGKMCSKSDFGQYHNLVRESERGGEK